jgi:DNA-binding MarR family transcriptional regulator
VLDTDGVRIRDLPRLTGVSKEANAMCSGWLRRRDCAEQAHDPNASRGQVLRLTAKGRGAQAKYRRILADTEDAWRSTYGSVAMDNLRQALEALVGDGNLASSPLAAGIEPQPENWRATVRRPETLPHYPMVLHRGAYPDGS